MKVLLGLLLISIGAWLIYRTVVGTGEQLGAGGYFGGGPNPAGWNDPNGASSFNGGGHTGGSTTVKTQ